MPYHDLQRRKADAQGHRSRHAFDWTTIEPAAGQLDRDLVVQESDAVEPRYDNSLFETRSTDGWFMVRKAGGKVAIAPVAAPDTDEVFQMHALAESSVLIGAQGGLFVARDTSGKVTLEHARDPETGPVRILRGPSGGGVLIGAAAGWFVAREAGSKVTVTPAGPITIGSAPKMHETRATRCATCPAGAC